MGEEYRRELRSMLVRMSCMEHDFVVRARGRGTMPSGLLEDVGEVLLGSLDDGAGGDGGGVDGGAGGTAAAVSGGDAGLREVRNTLERVRAWCVFVRVRACVCVWFVPLLFIVRRRSGEGVLFSLSCCCRSGGLIDCGLWIEGACMTRHVVGSARATKVSSHICLRASVRVLFPFFFFYCSICF